MRKTMCHPLRSAIPYRWTECIFEAVWYRWRDAPVPNGFATLFRTAGGLLMYESTLKSRSVPQEGRSCTKRFCAPIPYLWSCTHFFGLEPYATYKDWFNVYAVVSKSDDSGIGTVNTVVDTKFGSTFTQNRILTPDADKCFTWAKKADASMNLSKSLVILLMNTSTYEGVTMMYGDGSAIACCPVSTDAYPYDFRGIIQHEAGGHGFGKLGDEYIYHNAYIQTCNCKDGCGHPANFDSEHSRGWYRNLSMTADSKSVPWAHLIYHKKYSDKVDMYEGGYMHSRGVYRSEATSCMNNNIPYYSAISRQAIVERIMEYAGETFDFDDFVAKDSFEVGTKSMSAAMPFGISPTFVRATGEAPIYMGEHPNVK